MGEILQFPKRIPLPEPPKTDSRLENMREQCLAAFRMLEADFLSGKRNPEKMFLMYGSRWKKADGRDGLALNWSYLALELHPAELAAAVKMVIKDLKKKPTPPPDDCA